MTGKQEKLRIKRCPLCGGELHDSTTIVPFFINDKVIVVKDVPAEVCEECSEAYMKSSVTGRIEDLLDKIEALDSDMSIIHYKAA